MAFRSNIYEENQLNAYRKAQEAQRQAEEQQRQAYERALQAQNEAAQAQNKQMNPLESVLSGIGNSLNNAKEGLIDFFGTGFANLRDIGDSIAGGRVTTKNQDDWKEYRKKTRYGDENMSDKDYYLKTGGTALDTAATLSDLIPVAGQGSALLKGMGKAGVTGLNVAQGIASGIANPLIEYGSNASLEDVLRGGIVGGAGAGVGQYVGNKLGSRVPGTSKLSKLVNSNVGKAAITGAASGAVGGGLNAGLTGNDVLQGSLQGAQSGALGGATMAGVMGTLGKGIEKLQNKYGATTNVADNVVNKATQEATQDIAQKVAQENADVATAPTKRNIPITDYDNGDVPIRVRGANQRNQYSLGKGQGSLIDGILAPDNVRQLPNAQKPNPTIGEYMLGDKSVTNAYDAVPRLIEETWGDSFNKPLYEDFLSDLDAPTRAKLTDAVRDMASLNNMTDGETTFTSKSQLPKIRTSDYTEATGYSGKDIPDYMRPYLAKDGLSLKDGAWAQYMPKYSDGGTFTGTPDDILGVYDRLAGTNQNNIYTADNIGMALKMDPELNQAVADQLLRAGYPTRNINVSAAPSIADNIDVQDNNLAPIRTTKRVLNPNAPEAQPTQRAAQTMPAQETPLIQKGTPEYDEMIRQESIANRKRELRQNIVGGVMDQYGTTRLNDRINGLDDAIMDLANLGLTERSKIDGFASRITGADGEIPKVIRKSLNDAGDVPAQMNKSMQQVYEESGAAADQGAQKRIKSFFDSRNKKYTTNEDGTMARLDMYDLGKECEKEGYKMVDRAYRTQNPSTEAYGEALVNISRQLIEQATDGVDIRANLNVNKLKNLLPGNDAWAARVDDFAANAKTVQDARSFISSPTKLSLLAQAEEYNRNTFGQNAGDMGKLGAKAIKSATSANPVAAVAQMGATVVSESKPFKQGLTKKYLKQYQNIENGGNGVVDVTGKTKELAKNIGGRVAKNVSGLWDTLNNDTFSGSDIRPITRNGRTQTIGDVANRQLYRQAALGAMRGQDIERDMQNAQLNYQNALQDYSNASNQALQAQSDVESARAQVGTGNGGSQLDAIAQAMDRAMTYGDLTAYNKLASLYQQAYNIEKLRNPETTKTTSDAKALNATQSKAISGLQQLQQLYNMQPGVRTALANSPLSGYVDLTGGDEYNAQADSLATTLGYLLSGANIKDSEIAAIKRDYIPSTFDSPTVRQQKLSRAEQLLRNYLSDTNALTAL